MYIHVVQGMNTQQAAVQEKLEKPPVVEEVAVPTTQAEVPIEFDVRPPEHVIENDEEKEQEEASNPEEEEQAEVAEEPEAKRQKRDDPEDVKPAEAQKPDEMETSNNDEELPAASEQSQAVSETSLDKVDDN